MAQSAFKNIIANYGSRLWAFISIYLFIPFYIKLLGVESYAIISFYTLILGIVSFADAGLSSATNREFAKHGTNNHKWSVLLLFEKYYTLICLFIMVLIMLSAPYLAGSWLQPVGIENSYLTLQIRLIGIGVAIQLLTSLYSGGLMGLQHQVAANAMQMCWSFAKTAGVTLVLYLVRADLTVFFICQILCNVLYLLALRYHLKRSLFSDNAKTIEQRETWSVPADLLKYLGGMTLIAMISSLNIQADKLITSKVFTLEEFGYYSLASTIGQLPLLLASPLAIVVFPMMTKLISEGRMDTTKEIYQTFSFWLNCIIAPVSVIVFLYSSELLTLWTNNEQISPAEIEKIQWATKFLVIGNAFLAMQLMPFYFLMAKGHTKYTIRQGIIQLLFTAPALYICIRSWGISGAGIPWVIINLGAYVYLLGVIQRHYMRLDKAYSYVKAQGIPLLVSLLTGLLIKQTVRFFPQGPYVLVYCAITGVAALCISLAIFYKFSLNYFKKSIGGIK